MRMHGLGVLGHNGFGGLGDAGIPGGNSDAMYASPQDLPVSADLSTDPALDYLVSHDPYTLNPNAAPSGASTGGNLASSDNLRTFGLVATVAALLVVAWYLTREN